MMKKLIDGFPQPPDLSRAFIQHLCYALRLYEEDDDDDYYWHEGLIAGYPDAEYSDEHPWQNPLGKGEEQASDNSPVDIAETA